jgi:hypothetical protein
MEYQVLSQEGVPLEKADVCLRGRRQQGVGNRLCDRTGNDGHLVVEPEWVDDTEDSA